MKKKIKLNIKELEVQSFVTSLPENSIEQVKGASGNCVPQTKDLTILPNCMVGFSMGAHVCTRDSC